MRTAIKTLLAFAALSFAAVPAVAYSLTAFTVAVPDGSCEWVWVGPGTGWVKVADTCSGSCTEPAGPGMTLGQRDFTPCTVFSQGQCR